MIVSVLAKSILFCGTMNPLPFYTQYSVPKTHRCCCVYIWRVLRFVFLAFGVLQSSYDVSRYGFLFVYVAVHLLSLLNLWYSVSSVLENSLPLLI